MGALCLNETGQTQLRNRPTIIPAIFTIFTSERHLKVLIDKENAVIIGTAIDELVRHHPLLKAAVFTSLKSTLSAIEEIGRSYRIPDDLLHWYQLTPTVATPVDTDVKMEDFEPAQSEGVETEMADVSSGDPFNGADEGGSKTHDNPVVSFIDVLCRVCSDFLSEIVRFDLLKFLSFLKVFSNTVLIAETSSHFPMASSILVN